MVICETPVSFFITTLRLIFSVRMLSCSACPTLCNSMDCSSPGSSVLGILQARILEWVATPSSRISSQPRDCRWILYHLSHQGSPFSNPQRSWKKDIASSGAKF